MSGIQRKTVLGIIVQEEAVLQEPQQQSLLLIEKHRKLEICFKDALLRKGYTVSQVNSGGEGLVRLNGFQPDVIVINAASLVMSILEKQQSSVISSNSCRFERTR